MTSLKKASILLALIAAIPFVLALRSQPDAEEIPFYGPKSFAHPTHPVASTARSSAEALASDASLQLRRGQVVYEMMCQPCHMPDGRGLAGVLPPLAGADFLLADRERAARTILHGLSGEIVVNGAAFNSAMPALGSMLSDQQVADVLTFVFNSWGNTGAPFSAGDVRRQR